MGGPSSSRRRVPALFVDHTQQLELRPKGLFAQTLAQLVRPHDHNAQPAAARNLLPAEVVRAGLVAHSRNQHLPRFSATIPSGFTATPLRL